MIRNRKHSIYSVLFLFMTVCLTILSTTSCKDVETYTSNRKERNAIKQGNKEYNYSKDRSEYLNSPHDFAKAAAEYAKAMEANPESEVAKLNWATATLLNTEADSAMVAQADTMLVNLARSSTNPVVIQNAMFNRAKAYVDAGDRLDKEAKSNISEDNPESQQTQQSAYAYYEKAKDIYEEMLRRNPGDLEVTQNLRIVQLKLPEEQQQDQQQNQQQEDKDKQNQDQNKDQQDQDNDQDQDEKENQEKEQPQPNQPEQQPQANALDALQQREAELRRKNADPAQPVNIQNKKPW